MLIATDGSGDQGGSWAFVVWCRWQARSYRISWAAAPLGLTPWHHPVTSSPHEAQCSFHSELTALQAAAAWCAAAVDFWQLHMGSSPTHVTIAVDNAAALQVASGAGMARGTHTATTRWLWQCVQGRVSTEFRHVHSHQGTMVNTLADALAGLAHSWGYAPSVSAPAGPRLAVLLAKEGHLLWTIPRATLANGRPVLTLPYFTNAAHGDSVTAPPSSDPVPDTTARDECPVQITSSLEPVPVQVITANVQSMRDAKFSFFNPSGHAARRQYLLQQASDIPCDIVCIQEARSRAGRWHTGGWLSWRSGHERGQYGCEIWVRPSLLSPPLTLNSWRIVASLPRILAINGVLCSRAARGQTLAGSTGFLAYSQRSALASTLLIGIDANADLFAQDSEASLIGTRIAAGEPERNDLMLLDFCVQPGGPCGFKLKQPVLKKSNGSKLKQWTKIKATVTN